MRTICLSLIACLGMALTGTAHAASTGFMFYGCQTKALLSKLLDAAARDDNDAIRSLIRRGKCAMIPAGVPAVVLSRTWMDWVEVALHPPGKPPVTIWTTGNAIRE